MALGQSVTKGTLLYSDIGWVWWKIIVFKKIISFLNQVRHVSATLGHRIEIPRLFKKELGGGAMLDLGVYGTFLVGGGTQPISLAWI